VESAVPLSLASSDDMLFMMLRIDFVKEKDDEIL